MFDEDGRGVNDEAGVKAFFSMLARAKRVLGAVTRREAPTMLVLTAAIFTAVGDTRSWLDKNANEDGVTVLRSGVQFRIEGGGAHQTRLSQTRRAS